MFISQSHPVLAGPYRIALAIVLALGSMLVVVPAAVAPSAGAQDDLTDQIPAEVLAELEAREPDIVRGLRDGSITEIPNSVVDALPTQISDQIPADLTAGASGTFIAILIIVGVIALAGFFYGMVKSAIKAALFFGLVAAVAFFVLFTV